MLHLNIVQVFEPNPPSGEPPVEWLLATTEPIDSPEQICAIIDGYRTRWVIEEYFKALKTGCAYEDRQLESLHGLENALGLLAPVAVDLLRIRSTAREEPTRPAADVASDIQIALLRKLSVRHQLPAHPNARDIFLSVAGLGGHLKRNGDPGWIVLHRGYQKLLVAEMGWLAARDGKRCDQ